MSKKGAMADFFATPIYEARRDINPAILDLFRIVGWRLAELLQRACRSGCASTAMLQSKRPEHYLATSSRGVLTVPNFVPHLNRKTSQTVADERARELPLL